MAVRMKRMLGLPLDLSMSIAVGLLLLVGSRYLVCRGVILQSYIIGVNLVLL